jgi:peroxin-6
MEYLLDAALLRPGRFDKMLYLGVSDTHEKQLTIMEALTRKYVSVRSPLLIYILTNPRFTLHPTLSLPRIASKLPFTYTGADFYALCSDAMLKAVTRQASLVDSKLAALNASSGKPKVSTAYFFDHYATTEDTAVMVTEDDFLSAERELVPSVSVKELEHYKRVRAQFEKPVEEKASQGLAARPKSSGKGKGKAVDRKGKGKAVERWDVVDEDEEEYAGGLSNGKGKGKAVDMGFQQGTEEDDEGLY